MASEKGIDSEDQTTPDNLVDTDEIRCICGISDDDGYTIQCDNCYTWQHIRCMKADPEANEYKCHNCSDVKLEKLLKEGKKSKKHQKVRHSESGVYSSPAPQMSESSIIGTSNKSRNRSSDLSSTIKERQSSSHSKDYESIEKNIITSKAVEELFPKIYSQYQHRKRSMSLSSTSKPDNEHNRDDNNQESSSLRSTSPSLEIGNPFNMEKESLARPFMKTIVKQVKPKMLKKHFNCYGLFAETNISPGLFIVEFKGEVCLKSEYKANESNQYSLLGVTQPFVLFYPVLNLCVDARRVGTEARFIRRSCHPNAETRTIVVPGGDEVHLGIFSKIEILKGREITIGWDWESNHIANSLLQLQDSIFENDDENTLAKKRDEIGKVTAAILRLTECACENKDDCIIYKMQSEGKTSSKSRKNKKLVLDVEEMSIEGDSPEDYEDDMDSSQKKRKGKQNAERLNESSLNGNNKNLEENEVSSQIGRKDKKKVKEVDTKSDNIVLYSQKNKGKESANRVREETSGNIKKKFSSSRKSTGNRHARSSPLSSSKRRLQHDDDEGQHSDSSLSSVNSEMFVDDDFPNTSIIEVTPSNADKNIPNEQINKESNEDQSSVLYDPSNKIDHSIETSVNDILLQSSTNPPRPLPPAISQIPFKDYLIQMHEWKKAIEAISTSASTENDNPSSSTLHGFNVEMTSEYIEPENIGKSKGSKSNPNEDLITDKDDEIDHDEGLVPLPTPIIPAKRVASSPGPTLNNQNGKYIYNENGSDVKGKRQKTEELQNLSKGKGKEVEIEKEGDKIPHSLTSDNRDNVESTTLMKASGDLKKQITDSSTTYNSTNEASKTMTPEPRKLSLNEYRNQKAISALNKEASERKSTTEDPKSPISSVTDNDKKDNKTIDNNDTLSSLPVSSSNKQKPSLREQDKIRLESSNNDSVNVLKKSTDLVSAAEEFKQKSDIIENKINEQTKSEEVVDLTVVGGTSPKSPKLSKTEDNKSSLVNDGYFPDVNLPFDFPIAPLDASKDINAFNTNEYGRHANSSHSDGSYEETRGRHSPYKDYSSIKSSGNYNSSYNIPLSDTSMQTSPRPEHTSPPRGPRYYGGGHFRGNRMGGSYRGMSMSPVDRGRYHSGSGYFNSAGSTPRQGAQSSMMTTSSASSPYDPANPDGQSANTPNERDPILDSSNIVGNNSGSGITMESKARDYARSGGDRSDLRDRWSYSNYTNMDRSREREWRERERDDGRKDWNNKRLDHYREREYTGTSELQRYPMSMITRRPSNQDRYTMIGGTVPTGPAAGLNPSPSGISKNNEQSSSNNPSQRFGVDDHRRNRR